MREGFGSTLTPMHSQGTGRSSSTNAAMSLQAINLHLARKPSGCVIWTRFDSTDMRLAKFLFFGAGPGQPLPDLSGFAIAKHTKGDSKGVKKEKPNLRVVPKSKFQPIDSIGALYQMLFGTAI